MKLSIIAAIAAIAVSPAVFAGSINSTFEGHAGVSSHSQGFTGAVSSVYGSGLSFQASISASHGMSSATLETDLADHNIQVTTDTQQHAWTGSAGFSTEPTYQGGDLVNGTQGFATSKTNAWSNAGFDSFATFNN